MRGPAPWGSHAISSHISSGFPRAVSESGCVSKYHSLGLTEVHA